MFLQRPHLRFDGVYICRMTYVRQGEQSYIDQTYKPWYLVEYYRFIRVFPDGGCDLSYILPLVFTKEKVKTKLVSLQYVPEGMDLWVEDLCLCFFIKLLVILYIVGQNHTHMALCEQIYEFFTWLVLFCTFINIHQHSSTFINRRVNDVIITNLAENVFVLIYTIFEKFIYRGNNKRVAFDRLKYSIPRTFDS